MGFLDKKVKLELNTKTSFGKSLTFLFLLMSSLGALSLFIIAIELIPISRKEFIKFQCSILRNERLVMEYGQQAKWKLMFSTGMKEAWRLCF